MRTRKNRVVVYFNDRELERLNRMVERTVFSRERFIREMLAGFSIREAPPAPLWETVCFLRRAASALWNIQQHSMFRQVEDEELLRETLQELKLCASQLAEQCMPKFKEEKRK